MSENILKSNFKIKKPVVLEAEKKDASPLQDYHKRALVSIGGSMVYMKRRKLTWDGEGTQESC